MDTGEPADSFAASCNMWKGSSVMWEGKGRGTEGIFNLPQALFALKFVVI